MKKVLITGANSYVGDSLEQWIKQECPGEIVIETIDMIGDSWRTKSFKGFDCIVHVAGIAHIKETKENRNLYFKVNKQLAIETAEKAKEEGVSQFIFFSTMSVYGRDTGIITKETIPNPKTSYGKSKLQAEEILKLMEDRRFKVCIVRPPMIYGKGCKGNFQQVVKLVKTLNVFPKVNNQRSMIHIDNMCSFLKKCIDMELSGVFFPQNDGYMNTSEMSKWISETLGKKLYTSYVLGWMVKILQPFLGVTRKAFGTLIYKDTEEFGYDYCVERIEDSVKKSV